MEVKIRCCHWICQEGAISLGRQEAYTTLPWGGERPTGKAIVGP